jgi:hypothetical protein
LHGLGKRKKGRDTGNRTGPAPKQGGPVGPVRPAQWGPGGSSPRFFFDLLLFDFLLRSENFKGSLNKENEVSRVFIFGLFIWPNWELGIPSHLARFCTHASAMVSPRTVELKQGAKEPSMEEAKRCELKLPVEIKRMPASVAEGVSQPELSHLATPSKRRRSLLPFEGRRTSVS